MSSRTSLISSSASGARWPPLSVKIDRFASITAQLLFGFRFEAQVTDNRGKPSGKSSDEAFLSNTKGHRTNASKGTYNLIFGPEDTRSRPQQEGCANGVLGPC